MGVGTDTEVPGGTFATRGHDAALRAVARAIRLEQPPQSLLIVGPRGVGKTTLALDLTAGLLCLSSDAAARPCRRCAACRKVAAANHPDVHVVGPDGAGEQIRLERVLSLTSELSLTAMEGRFRVAVITSAQRMNPDAQNALLKTLEEPGPATCLILCADDSAPLLPTVVSRTARLRLGPLAPDVLAGMLADGGVAEPAQARELALASAGRPGLALALAARPEALLARQRICRTLLDLVPADRRTRLSAAADLVEDAALLSAALRGEVASTGKRLPPVERRRTVTTILETWRHVGRDMLVTAIDRGDGRGIRDLGLFEDLKRVADLVEPAEVRRFLDHLDGLVLAIEGYASPELTLDALLLSWPRAASGAARAA